MSHEVHYLRTDGTSARFDTFDTLARARVEMKALQLRGYDAWTVTS